MGAHYFDNLVSPVSAPFLCRFLYQSGKGLVPGIFRFGLSFHSCRESALCHFVAYPLEKVHLDSLDPTINRIQSRTLYNRD